MRTAEVDYFKVLGVGSTTTAVEIKQKYRELSKKYHPDTNGGDAKRMMQINEAYGVLSDPLKRRNYVPPSAKPKAAPRQSSTNGYHSAQTRPAKRTNVKRKPKQAAQQDSISAWKALFFYVLAVPVAILIVTFALPFMQRMLPKISTVPTAAPQGPTTVPITTQTAPVQPIVPTTPSVQTPVPIVEYTPPAQTETPPATDTPGTTDDSNKPQNQSTLYYQFRRSGN